MPSNPLTPRRGPFESQLSPVAPIAASTNNLLLAKLLGDLSGYAQLPVLRRDRRTARTDRARTSAWEADLT